MFLRFKLLFAISISFTTLSAVPISYCFYEGPESYQLSADEQSQLKRGEVVKRTKDIEDNAWPEVTYFAFVDIEAAAATSIYYDVESYFKEIPKVLDVEVTNILSSTHRHVAFKIKVPWPISTSTYSVDQHIAEFDSGSYKIVWDKIESEHSESITGSICFMPYRGRTLLVYSTLISPKSYFAGLFKNNMINVTHETVRAIVKMLQGYIDKPIELQAHADLLRKSLE